MWGRSFLVQVLLRQHQWQNCCHGNSRKGVILFLLWWTFMVPSFKNTALIFPEISFVQFFYHISVAVLWHHAWPNLHNRKTSIYLKRKKIFQKEKRHSSVFLKAYQISRKNFLCHIHLKHTFVSIQNVKFLAQVFHLCHSNNDKIVSLSCAFCTPLMPLGCYSKQDPNY